MNLLQMTIGFFLPVGTVAVATIWLRARFFNSYTESFVMTFVATTALAVAVTEILGLVGLIYSSVILIVWVIALLALCLLLYRDRATLVSPHIPPGRRLAATIVALFIGVEFANVIIASPTGVDGYLYRLPRIMQWLQNHDLSAFPTIIERQFYVPPAADFMLLQAIGLSAGDTWVNMPQFFAGVVLISALAFMAKFISNSDSAWQLTAVLLVTTPVFLAQLISSQTDIISAAFVISALFVAVVTTQRHPRLGAFTLAVLLALSFSAKVTGALLILPVIVYFVWKQRTRLRTVLPPLIGGGLLAATFFVLPHFIRLYAVYGSFTAKSGDYFNFPFSLPIALLNVPRLALSQISTPIAYVNSKLTDWSASVFEIIAGQDVSEVGVWRNTSFRIEPWFTEDYVSAPFQLLLLIAFVFIVVIQKRVNLYWLVLIVLSQFLLLGAFFLWQPWINRFALPIVAIGVTGFSICVAGALKLLRVGLMSLAILIALPQMVYPKGREWLPSPGFQALGLGSFERRITPWNREYFAPASSEALVVERVVEIEPSLVRLYLPGFGKDGEGGFEYSWWPALRKYLPDVRIEHARSIPPMPPVAKPTGKYVTICVESCPIAPGETAENIGDLTLVSGGTD